jgi:hypothetical protein
MWFDRLHNVYASAEDFARWDEFYSLAARLGFKSAATAWKANPIVQGDTNPRKYRRLTPYYIRQQIRRGMALAFFGTAWADQCEEYGHGAMLSGRKIMDLLPRKIDPEALDAANELCELLESSNNVWAVAELWENCLSLPDVETLEPIKWGHYAAMQAMGHGVGLWEYGYTEEILRVPDVEFSQCSLSRDYFKPKPGYPKD